MIVVCQPADGPAPGTAAATSGHASPVMTRLTRVAPRYKRTSTGWPGVSPSIAQPDTPQTGSKLADTLSNAPTGLPLLAVAVVDGTPIKPATATTSTATPAMGLLNMLKA